MRSSLSNVLTNASNPIDKNLLLSINIIQTYVTDIDSSFVLGIKPNFTLSFFLPINFLKIRWQS